MRILTVATALAVQIQEAPESLGFVGLPSDDALALEPKDKGDDMLAEDEDALDFDDIHLPTDEEVQNDME